MSELIILKHGDMRISWDSRNKKEISAARETFEKNIKDGWSAFRDKAGTKGDKIDKFDPYAERITLVPPVSGG